jgi:hypothetical protein
MPVLSPTTYVEFYKYQAGRKHPRRCRAEGITVQPGHNHGGKGGCGGAG